jgi:hypothetical protein
MMHYELRAMRMYMCVHASRASASLQRDDRHAGAWTTNNNTHNLTFQKKQRVPECVSAMRTVHVRIPRCMCHNLAVESCQRVPNGFFSWIK